MTRISIVRNRLRREQQNLCYWCKCEMTDTFSPTRNKPAPDTMCTLDHVFSRLDPRRYEVDARGSIKHWLPGNVRRVAACFACNQARSVTEMEKRGMRALRHGTRLQTAQCS